MAINRFNVGDRLVIRDYEGPHKYIRVLSFQEHPRARYKIQIPGSAPFFYPMEDFDTMDLRAASGAEIILFFQK